MTYKSWKNEVSKFTIAEIRCDVPPSEDILDLMDKYGLNAWETFTAKLENEISH